MKKKNMKFMSDASRKEYEKKVRSKQQRRQYIKNIYRPCEEYYKLLEYTPELVNRICSDGKVNETILSQFCIYFNNKFGNKYLEFFDDTEELCMYNYIAKELIIAKMEYSAFNYGEWDDRILNIYETDKYLNSKIINYNFHTLLLYTLYKELLNIIDINEDFRYISFIRNFELLTPLKLTMCQYINYNCNIREHHIQFIHFNRVMFKMNPEVRDYIIPVYKSSKDYSISNYFII